MNPIFSFFGLYWRTFVIFIAPVVWLGVILTEKSDPASKCYYIIGVMALYWLTEAVPLPITGLIPLVLFPLMDLLSTGEVSVQYFQDVVFMLFTSIVMSAAILNVKLYKRITLSILLAVGCTAKRLGIGLMLSSFLMTFFCYNTATTIAMVPIGLSLLQELEAQKVIKVNEGPNKPPEIAVVPETKSEVRVEEPVKRTVDDETKPTPTAITNYFMICIAYGASIGGIATINGAIANFAFKGIFEIIFPKSVGISFGTFLLYGIPIALLSGVLVCLWLIFLFRKCFFSDSESSGKVKDWIRNQRTELGPICVKEMCIMFIALLVFLFWVARDLGPASGWKDGFKGKKVTNATPGIIAVALLFIIPRDWGVFNFCLNRERPSLNSPGLVTWTIANAMIPWGSFLVLGGGFAIAHAFVKTKLAQQIAKAVDGVKGQVAYILACLISQIFGTLSAGAVVACVALPFLAQMAVAAKIDPICVMFPATLCMSHAFMLPNAASPNSVIANLANVKTKVLMKAGSISSLITFIVVTSTFYLYGGLIYKNLDKLPDYAKN